MQRREFLRLSAAAAALSATPDAPVAFGASNDEPGIERFPPFDADLQDALQRAPDDDAFWALIRREYTPPAEYVDLDQANTAPTPRRVFDAFIARARRLSHAPAARFGEMWEKELDAVTRPALARYLGAAPEHLAFTANATSALNTVLHGFPLERGDEVLVTDHEYPDMIETLRLRARRDGIVLRVVRVSNASEDPLALVSRIAEAIGPRTRLMLISHISAWSGVILPVARATAAARARGVAVVVDAAQSVGILDVGFDAIGCDFLGASLHKGLAAPMPTGVLLMRPEHAGKVSPLHPPSWDTSKHPMDLYEWSGTFNMAALSTIKEALDFQRVLGAERKRTRLRQLGAYWQDALRGVSGVRMLTPREGDRSCGPAAFAIEGVESGPLAKSLRERRRVSVQDKAGPHSPFTNAIRVSPGAHTTFRELDRLVVAVRDIARAGRLP
ncbi:MAG: aminotransferase class V-fold PLP-dependent enzyme [Gemmatimonadota bacterium]